MAAYYQDLRNRRLAIELQLALQETIEQDQNGETIELEELARELGIELSGEETKKPEGYEQMIPERYHSAS